MAATFIDELKNKYRFGGTFIKLIYWNAIVFLTIGMTTVISSLISVESTYSLNEIWMFIFGLKTELTAFITHPWALFTSMFSHFGFWHFAMNMIFLYFAGQAFEQFFSGQRLMATYILGGLTGGVFEILAHLIFPMLQNQNTVVIGASGSVMAIFSAIAFYRPQLEVRLFGVLPIKMIYLALFFILMDFLKLGKPDGVAHFAHLGGVFIGFLSIRNLESPKNILTRSIILWGRIKNSFSSNSSRMKVVKKDVRKMTDEEYNQNAKIVQEEINRILEKISRSGYDSLNKREKELLFKQSRK